MATTPKYDNDLVTLGYLNEALNRENDETKEQLETIPRNYGIPPVPPYYVNSLLLLDGKVYRCIKSRLQGSFDISDWTIVINAKEIDIALKSIYDVNKLEYVDQEDGKIETFYQDTDPSLEWSTDIEKNNHVSDLWTRDIDTQYQYVKLATNPVTYQWAKRSVPTSLFDTIDGHKTIFLEEPINYTIDDLWLGETTKIAISNGTEYQAEDWVERDDFITSSLVEQEEYHTVYLIPKITEISRYTNSEIKKAVDEITLIVSQTYTTKTEVERYVDDIYTDVAEEYSTKTDTTAQIAVEAGRITALAERTTEVEGEIETLDIKTAKLSVEVDEIKGEIRDIADITITAEGNGTIQLENITESEPILVKIHPTFEDISYLYPSMNLYPSENLYLVLRDIIFTNGENSIRYTLPDDLLFYDDSVYDEFVLDYENKKCTITKRVDKDFYGIKYQLEKEIVTEYPYPTIQLVDGDCTISVESFGSAYIFARMMTNNIYTNQFATKVELNSSVTQTANNIRSEVSREYTTKGELNQAVSTINQTTDNIELSVLEKVGVNEVINKINVSNEGIKIDASKLDITGLVTFNDLSKSGKSTINGSNITTGSINASLITTGTLNAGLIKAGTLSADRVSGGTISGSSINLGNGTFSVNTSGALRCSNITATGGTIGGCTINHEAIFNGKGIGVEGSCGMSGSIPDWAFWAGNGAFRVAQNGYVSCNNIYANGGYIGGWNIGNTELSGYDYDGNRWSILPAGIKDKYGITISWAALVQISDKRLKNEIKDIEEKFEDLYNELSPKTFYFNDGCPDNKKHIGFIAQDVIEAQNKINEDLSMINQSPNGYYSLNKSEIIALNTWQIKKLKKEVQKLTEAMKKFERLEGQLNVN